MRNYLKICVVFVMQSLMMQGQDIHFSQFYNAPLLLNPAFTGNSESNIETGLNYRSQWNSISVPYITQAGFFEYKIVPDFLKRDWGGVGATMYQDWAGDGNLKTSFGMLYLSYHKGLNYDNSLFASFGAGAGFANKSVNYSALLFDSQWDGYKFNSALPNQELYSATSLTYFDFSAGAMFTYTPSIKFGTYAGVSLQHINHPKQTFYTLDFKNQLGRKLVIHWGLDKRLSNNFYLQPKLLFVLQKKANEFVFGSNVMYFRKDIKIFAGLWTRLSRDIIFTLGTEYKKAAIFFSYDYNYSMLNIISGGRGGFEISLVVLMDHTRKRKMLTGFQSASTPEIP
ncbi:MAG: PorP/SprF family type IX secretion system membrane protein [Bacteroidia bacterium]|nr:PorP/SprF family type IX secretion system membrane protein [Bacteroidia bacterium]